MGVKNLLAQELQDLLKDPRTLKFLQGKGQDEGYYVYSAKEQDELISFVLQEPEIKECLSLLEEEIKKALAAREDQRAAKLKQDLLNDKKE